MSATQFVHLSNTTTVLQQASNLEHPQDLWGVGQAWMKSGAGSAVPYPVSHGDMLADTAWMEEALEKMGVRCGDVGYIGYMNDQIAQYWPLFMACVSMGVPLATGMDLRFDAGRLEMFLRRLPIKFAFGLSQEIIVGIKAANFDLRATLARSPVVVACVDAWAELDALDLPYWRLLMLGPVMALESPTRDGFVFNSKEWKLSESGGQLLVTSHPARACPFDASNTGVQGRLFKAGSEWRVQVPAAAANVST